MLKVRPFYCGIVDGFSIGLMGGWDLHEFRIGLDLLIIEIGLLFTW